MWMMQKPFEKLEKPSGTPVITHRPMLSLEEIEIYEALKVIIATVEPKPSSTTYTNGPTEGERYRSTSICEANADTHKRRN